MYSATLTHYGKRVMERHGDTPEDALEALGGVSGPGYDVEVLEVRDEG